jgi:hypothetical protein
VSNFYPRATRRGAALDWVKFDAELARDGTVDPVDKALYAAIGSFVDAESRESPTTEGFDPNNIPPWVPTRKRLAECIGKSVDTVDRSTKRLEDRGLLRVHRQPDPTNLRRMLPSEYELLDHQRWDERAAERVAQRAALKSEGQTDAPGGGRTGAARGSRMGAATGGRTGAAVTEVQEEVEEEDQEAAPPARSAADVRRTTTGSSAREESGGFAATETPDPVAAESERAQTDGPAADAPKPKVPGPRGGRKASPFPNDVRQRIYATEALLPAPLRAALAVILPHGHLPNVNRQVIAQALQTRTPQQLADRAARRWITYGYERDHFDGVLRSPIGVVEELLRPTPYCPDPECEDGVHVHTDQPCAPCSERIARRKRDRKAGRAVPTHRPPRLYRDREQCGVCDRPFPGNAPDDRLCGACRAELDRGAAYVLGVPPDDQTDDQDDADPYMPAPPSREYRQWRANHAAAQTPQFEEQS